MDNTHSDYVAYYVYKHIIPAALDMLPGRMYSPEAVAMILAIGLQESKFLHRRQVPNGPANGFWQFEKGGGVKGVLTHSSTSSTVKAILTDLRYPTDTESCYQAIRHNDVLACVFARLLLWTVKGRLPLRNEPDLAWNQYLGAWKPGKPHPETWDENFYEAWRFIDQE